MIHPTRPRLYGTAFDAAEEPGNEAPCLRRCWCTDFSGSPRAAPHLSHMKSNLAACALLRRERSPPTLLEVSVQSVVFSSTPPSQRRPELPSDTLCRARGCHRRSELSPWCTVAPTSNILSLSHLPFSGLGSSDKMLCPELPFYQTNRRSTLRANGCATVKRCSRGLYRTLQAKSGPFFHSTACLGHERCCDYGSVRSHALLIGNLHRVQVQGCQPNISFSGSSPLEGSGLATSPYRVCYPTSLCSNISCWGSSPFSVQGSLPIIPLNLMAKAPYLALLIRKQSKKTTRTQPGI